MKIYPDLYLDSVKDITYEMLVANDIKALILDVDNTLIDYYKNMPDGIIEWCEGLKNKGIKLFIVSNSNKKDKVSSVAKDLGLKYTYLALKPLKHGFKKALRELKIPNKNVAAVGDQIFTDVIGAKNFGMFAILVKPIEEKDLLLTVVKRPIEKMVIERYKRKKHRNIIVTVKKEEEDK